MNKLIFIHVPKCAGRTVKDLLRSNYPKHFEINNMLLFRELAEDDLKIFDLIMGHITFNYVENLKDFKIFTVLRNPIERTISQYNHFMNMPTTFRLSKAMIERKYTFQDFIKSDHPEIANLVNVYTMYFGEREMEYFNVDSFLERAIVNLSKLDFIGTHENFKKTLNTI